MLTCLVNALFKVRPFANRDERPPRMECQRVRFGAKEAHAGRRGGQAAHLGGEPAIIAERLLRRQAVFQLHHPDANHDQGHGHGPANGPPAANQSQ